MKNELTTLFASLIQERNNETPLKDVGCCQFIY